MFILDRPYVSGLLQDTAARLGAPVLDKPGLSELTDLAGLAVAKGEDFVRAYDKAGDQARLYCNSEDSIGWIDENLAHTSLPGMIRVFKDKAAFRRLIAPLHPGYRFEEMTLAGLDDFDPSVMPFPFIIKPAVGFFSLGVHVVQSPEDWPGVVMAVKADAKRVAGMYPDQVLDAGRFVAEEVVAGDEYAVDAYFDARGKPVVVNVMNHWFASGEDVSDRVYVTSPEIVRGWMEPFADYLGRVGELAGLRNFPVHAELRVDSAGHIAPIEINPMRFAGWCCTDLAFFAYGVNTIEHYLGGTVPDWDEVLAGREGSLFSLVVADLPGGLDREAIAAVDVDAFAGHFSRPLEVRPVDWKRYGVFAFAFARVPAEDTGELESILRSDLTEYLRMKG